MTVDEFLAWHPECEETYQLVDGAPVAIPIGCVAHGLVQAETGRIIGNHLFLTRSDCHVLVAASLQPRVRASYNLRVADLAVTCAPPSPDARFAASPVIAIEIFPPDDERRSWQNVWSYTTIPSIQEILCVRLAFVGVDLLRRGADGYWPEEPERVTTGPLTLESIGFSCDVSAIYRTTHSRGPLTPDAGRGIMVPPGAPHE